MYITAYKIYKFALIYRLSLSLSLSLYIYIYIYAISILIIKRNSETDNETSIGLCNIQTGCDLLVNPERTGNGGEQPVGRR